MFLEINFIYIIYIHKMTNSDVDTMKMMGGKRKNGHKMDCGCPICGNMKKKKGGDNPDNNDTENKEEPVGKVKTGSDEEATKLFNEMKALPTGGSKKTKRSNGHKPGCGCPICNNMKKKTRRQKKKRNSKRRN
jgi:hypothetical protein